MQSSKSVRLSVLSLEDRFVPASLISLEPSRDVFVPAGPPHVFVSAVTGHVVRIVDVQNEIFFGGVDPLKGIANVQAVVDLSAGQARLTLTLEDPPSAVPGAPVVSVGNVLLDSTKTRIPDDVTWALIRQGLALEAQGFLGGVPTAAPTAPAAPGYTGNPDVDYANRNPFDLTPYSY